MVAASPARRVGALAALSLAAFSVVTAEVLPIGLLTVIAGDLHRSVPATGLLVTGYALVVVLASLPLARSTRAVPRRMLLAGLLGAFTLANLAAALAPDYRALLGARLLGALAHALFWSVVGAATAGLFAPRVRGRAMAALFTGSSLGPVVGVPAGTWLGQQAGWRAAFVAMSLLGLVTWIAVAALLPTSAPEHGGAARGTRPDPRRYGVLVAATAIGVTGLFTAATYVTPFLLDVAGYPARALGVLLVVAGIAGVLGAGGSGAVFDRWPRVALAAPMALAALALAGQYAFGGWRAPAIVFVSLAGVAMGSFAAAIQSRALQVAPGSTDIASAGTSSAFNVGIMAGSSLGGALVAAFGVRGTTLAGALIAAAALAVLLAEPRLARPRERPAGLVRISAW
jgi:DHA1 family inner membrane transport protein